MPKHETVMRAALVTLGPSWPGDHEWTGHYLFSSNEAAVRYFESEKRVLEIQPDFDSEFFTASSVYLSRRSQ